MTTAWSHLPNAAHIDRILADVKADPAHLAAVLDAALDAAMSAALDAAMSAALDAARNAAMSAARNAATDVARSVAYEAAYEVTCDAVAALIAWDESSDYLNMTSDQVQVMLLLGDHKAVLLLPAVLAFEKSKELA